MKKTLIFVLILAAITTLFAGCKQAAKEKGAGVYAGYWFVLAEYDQNGEETDLTGNTRFNITLSENSKISLYSEAYNYAKKVWFERRDILPGYTYTYDKDKDELTVQCSGGKNIIFRKATYKGGDVIEMAPFYPGATKEKTVLTRTNPRPK